MDTNEWFEAKPEPARTLARALHERVRAAAPALAVGVSGEMLVHGPFRYRYASGREGDSALVSLAVRSGGISVYVNSVRADGTYVPEAHAGKLGKVKVGKSCIVVRKLADLDLEAFDAVLREAATLGGAAALG
jgi:hypothetical protein